MSSLIGNVPREKLKELLDKHGDVLLQDRDRCEGLLKDHCGAYRKEISALVGALDERIPLELKSSWQTAMTPEAMRARLVQRLEENRGLAPDVAMWAVDAWSHALGVSLGRSSVRVEEATVDAASVSQRVASDRLGRTRGGPASTLTTKKKAGIAAAAALVVAVAAFAMFHHPTPPGPTPNNGGGGTTANGGSGGGVNSGGNSGGAASEETATGVPSGGSVAGGGAKPEAGKTANGTGRGAGAGGGTGGVSGGAKSGGGNMGDASAGGKAAVAANAPTLPVGTSFAVRLDKALNSSELNEGDLVAATVASPVTLDGNVLVPAGAAAHLRVSGLTREGKMQALKLALADVSLQQGPMATTSELHSFEGPPLKGDPQKRGGIGGVVSKLFHRGGAGAATGTEAAKPDPVKLPAETTMHFSLTAPAKVLK